MENGLFRRRPTKLSRHMKRRNKSLTTSSAMPKPTSTNFNPLFLWRQLYVDIITLCNTVLTAHSTSPSSKGSRESWWRSSLNLNSKMNVSSPPTRISTGWGYHLIHIWRILISKPGHGFPQSRISSPPRHPRYWDPKPRNREPFRLIS